MTGTARGNLEAFLPRSRQKIWITITLFLMLSKYPASASYLEFPRLNFAGFFRADTSTINNCNCNYNLPRRLVGSWNLNGTGEFYFFNSTVTSVVYENGTMTENDPVVNSSLVSNLGRPPPKLVDVDTDAQMKSTVYGMKVSVVPNGEADTSNQIFEADWARLIIAYDIWERLLCSEGGDPRLAAQGTSRLENVKWGDLRGSTLLEQLRKASENGSLSIRISHYYFTSSYLKGNFTFGNVVGSIGVAKAGEALNAGGQRLLSYQDVPFANITVSETDSCHAQPMLPYYWAYKAPFNLQQLPETENYFLSIDLSNSLAMDLFGNLRDLGTLQFAIYIELQCCMQLIGPNFSYLEDGWLKRTSGIVDIPLQGDEIVILNESKTPLLLVTLSSTEYGNRSYDICSKDFDPFESLTVSSSENGNQFAQILLREIRFFIRPIGYIVSRLQRTYNESASFDLLVTDYGKPAANESVSLTLPNPPLPAEGVIPMSHLAKTNANGIATFTLQLNNAAEERIPYPRRYRGTQNASCAFQTECAFSPNHVITIDGQIYHFAYNVERANATDQCLQQIHQTQSGQFVFCENFLTVLAHSDPNEFNYTRPYTWVDHIQPIFEQYYRLYPVMSKILNMSNYTDVTRTHNLNLLRFAMTRSFDDPTYMPVIRDLSPLKQEVILDWLDSPLYNANGMEPNTTEATCVPPRNLTLIPEDFICPAEHRLSMQPRQDDPFYDIYYNQHLIQNENSPQCQWQFDAASSSCTIESLREHAQQALELEFATIPLYMTSLYSIVDGCNTQQYSLIRSVLMQEMLHMSQVANILIAVGGEPNIDSNEAAPSYPTLGLPGCVLPGLNVTLERASLEHIKEIFMGVEFPYETEVALSGPEFMNATIGQFYTQMNNCISELASRNDPDLFDESRTAKQVQWPWNNTYGTLHIVRDVSSAMDGILEIIEQGEGASPIDPDATRDELAHFYKFEEIVCQASLELLNETHYSYIGEGIPFNPEGVWQMRNNPSKYGITRGTRAYFEARAFHQVYRNLLRKLQETFNGEPEKIRDAVAIMESLQVHAKRVMTIPLDPDDPNSETVGPVFDYLWED